MRVASGAIVEAIVVEDAETNDLCSSKPAQSIK